MIEEKIDLQWESVALVKYQNMIAAIPMFHRDIARQVVEKKAVINAQQRGALQVEEGDIVRAFLSEVPMTFYSLMIRLMQNAGFEYERYE